MSQNPRRGTELKRDIARCFLPICGVALLVAACGPFGGKSEGQVPGTILFGSGVHRVSAYQIAVKKPHDSFRDGKWMGWVAQLRKPLKARRVTISVVSVNSGQILWTHMSLTVNPASVQLAGSGPVDAFVKAGLRGPLPGRYRLEYLRGSVVLAQGTFRITG